MTVHVHTYDELEKRIKALEIKVENQRLHINRLETAISESLDPGRPKYLRERRPDSRVEPETVAAAGDELRSAKTSAQNLARIVLAPSDTPPEKKTP